jgi:hypothetical protein
MGDRKSMKWRKFYMSANWLALFELVLLQKVTFGQDLSRFESLDSELQLLVGCCGDMLLANSHKSA